MSTSFDASQYKVLCVDDEPNILSSLRRMLSLEGFQVATAESGATALAMLDKEKFHVVLSDMQMPQMNGAQLFDAARQQHPNTMRVLLTGAADVNSAIAAINQGEIYRYLTKPWNDAELVGVLKSAIELGELAKAREAKLRASYISSIKAFSGLMALRRPDLLAPRPRARAARAPSPRAAPGAPPRTRPTARTGSSRSAPGTGALGPTAAWS